MTRLMASDDRRSGEILAGIRLLHEEFKELRVDISGALGSAAEDRKRADQDRRRADEDRKETNEKFERLMAQSDKRFNQVMRGVLNVGRRILAAQQEHTRLLQGIRKSVSARPNGRHGNGNGRSRK